MSGAEASPTGHVARNRPLAPRWNGEAVLAGVAIMVFLANLMVSVAIPYGSSILASDGVASGGNDSGCGPAATGTPCAPTPPPASGRSLDAVMT